MKTVVEVDPTVPVVLTPERRKELAAAARKIRRAARAAVRCKTYQKSKSKKKANPTANSKSAFTKGILNRV